jgi:predicted Zn-dependent peptidase
MGRMQAVGMGWTYLKSYRSVDEELANFDAVSLKDVRNVLDRYPFDQMTVLALGPLANLEG